MPIERRGSRAGVGAGQLVSPNAVQRQAVEDLSASGVVYCPNPARTAVTPVQSCALGEASAAAGRGGGGAPKAPTATPQTKRALTAENRAELMTLLERRRFVRHPPKQRKPDRNPSPTTATGF